MSESDCMLVPWCAVINVCVADVAPILAGKGNILRGFGQAVPPSRVGRHRVAASCIHAHLTCYAIVYFQSHITVLSTPAYPQQTINHVRNTHPPRRHWRPARLLEAFPRRTQAPVQDRRPPRRPAQTQPALPLSPFRTGRFPRRN